jgi:hypothetical protein
MTDRERINKTYGLLAGAAYNARWVGHDKYLVCVTIIDTILDILNVEPTAKDTT